MIGSDGGTNPCSGATQPLDQTWTLTWQSTNRTLDVHVPAAYDGVTPMPVVLDFHGYTENASMEESLSGMNTKADAANFIAVHPNGIGTSWNAGACCGTAVSQNVDDIGFTGAILDALETRLCVDSKRLFAAGMSNGGFLSHRIGCELSSRIAAIAPVAGVMGISNCAPSRAMPVIGFHGTGDLVVPYNGSSILGYMAAPATYDGWATRDGCTTTTTQTYSNMDSTCATYQGCPSGVDVVFCTVQNGGHSWPGGNASGGFGYTTPYLSATDAMWTFFVNHPLP